MSRRLSSTGKGLVAAFLTVAALAGGGAYLLNHSDETHNDDTAQGTTPGSTAPVQKVNNKEQESVSIYWDYGGRTYAIWEGVIIEELNNITGGYTNHQTDFDHHIYDFDLGMILHVTQSNNSNGGTVTRTLFNELAAEDGTLPPHIDNVRDIGCRLAQTMIDRAETPEFGPAPADAVAFKERHCPAPETP